MQQPLPLPALRETEPSCRDLQVATEYAISLVCDSLIRARQLQHAIDARWRLIMETKRISSEMKQLALRKPAHVTAREA